MSSNLPVAEANPTTQLAEDRRAAVRYRCLRDCIVRLEGATPGVGDWPGMTYDLSVIGVGVTILYPLALGTVLIIEKFGRSARPLHARVVRSVPMEFVWLHGCQLTTPLNEAELQEWLR
ncbi:MAG TPA: PilZ domain-containing protein [Gemmataceae bacterium]|jgi:hypothetical protein|nr:PilZ domain-containing protein [Gemmataceae bacterium]